MELFLNIKQALMPEMLLSILICITTILCFCFSEAKQKIIYYVSLIGLLLIGSSFYLMDFVTSYQANYSFVSDCYSLVFRILIIIGAIVCLMLSKKYVSNFGNSRGEYFVLLLTAILGAMMLTGANDLILVFVGLETLSLSSYALCGYTSKDKFSLEASLKYLIFGGAASAIMLYGFSLIYGIVGHTNLYSISNYLSSYETNLVLVLSMVLVLVGFGFKLSLFPSQAWTPDVYQGAPVPVAAFLATVSKVAVFALLIRFFTLVYCTVELWPVLISIVAVLTMSIGNFIAMKQTNIRRLMAYSSIAHAGYILAAFAVFTTEGISAMIFYLICYLVMNLGVWAAIEIIINKTGRDDINVFDGLAYKKPLFAFAFVICLLSLAGIPITAGFFAKIYIFKAIMLAGIEFLPLLILTLLNTLVAIFYYLNVVKVMFINKSTQSLSNPIISSSKSLNTVLIVTATLIILMGIFVTPIFELAHNTAQNVNIGLNSQKIQD